MQSAVCCRAERYCAKVDEMPVAFRGLESSKAISRKHKDVLKALPPSYGV